MSIFGWSYPPGVTGNEPEIAGYDGPCDICGYGVDECSLGGTSGTWNGGNPIIYAAPA